MPHPLFSLSGSGSTTTVGISAIRSSGLPECRIRVKPPIWQSAPFSLSHAAFTWARPPGRAA